MDGNFLTRAVHRFRTVADTRAICFMLVSTAGFSTMNFFVRLASHSLDATVIVTLRNLITLALLVPFVIPNKFAIIRTTRLKDHFWRGAIGSVGMLTWTYCLTIIPIVHATALSFTAPLLVTLFAILVLKERASQKQLLSLAIGFMATLLILRPGLGAFAWKDLLVIFATSSWAVTSLFVKSLSRTEPALRMVFYMNFFMSIIALPFGFTHWQMPDMETWFVLLGVALCSLVMHFSMVKAYSLAPVVTLMPFDFMRLVYTSLLAYFYFGETSDWITWLGAAIIVVSSVFLARKDVKETALE